VAPLSLVTNGALRWGVQTQAAPSEETAIDPDALFGCGIAAGGCHVLPPSSE
jgi:hypothetical protein